MTAPRAFSAGVWDAAAPIDRAIAITDEVVAMPGEAAYDAMRAAYLTSSRLWWMLWDSAYRMERWLP